MRVEVRLTGSGGQGIILAGIVLAEAAVIAGVNAVQTQAYGPEARGGASKSEVIIADEEIDYPKVTEPDLVLAMNEISFGKYGVSAPDKTTVIVDGSLVNEQIWSVRDVVALPITATAVEVTGKAVTANVTAVGVLAKMEEIREIISLDCVREAVFRHVPERMREVNAAALEAGFGLWSGHCTK